MTVISAWWRLNIRLKDPVGDRVGVELLFNSVEFGSQSSCQQSSRQLETRCGREGHTRARVLGSHDGGDPNIRRTRKTQRDGHNNGVKIWSLCSVSITLSHANLEQPFRTLAIKWEVNIFLKKSSCVFLPSCVFPLASLLLCRCDAWTCKWLYNTQPLPKYTGHYCTKLITYTYYVVCVKIMALVSQTISFDSTKKYKSYCRILHRLTMKDS